MGGGTFDLGGGGPAVFLFILGGGTLLGGILFYIRITVFSQSSFPAIYSK